MAFAKHFSHCLCLLCLCLTFALFQPASLTSSQSLGLGLGYSSPSPETNQTLLVSAGAIFSAGFHPVGINAYAFAVWYTNTTESPTIVWMANRDQPINGRYSHLHLHRDGDFVLINANGSAVWRTSTRGLSVNAATLLDTGNLVLRSSSGKILWQSFDFPTDTLLPGQTFTKDTQLVSRMDNVTYKSGYHSFFFNDENYLALIHRSSIVSSKYWPSPWLSVFQNERTTYNVSRLAFLDRFGNFSSSDGFNFSASDYGDGPKRRLIIDVDGNLRLYSFDPYHRKWIITWMAIAEQCRVHGLCGLYGLCIYTPQPTCVCPPGFTVVDSTDWFKGCRAIKQLSCNPNSTQLVKLRYTDYYGFDNSGYATGRSLEECRKSCLDDCDCLGFAYRITGTGQCFLKFLLVNGYQSPGVINDMYVKISSPAVGSLSMSGSSLYCSNETQPQENVSSTGEKREKRSELIVPLVSFASTVGFTEIVCIALGWWVLFRNFDEDNFFQRRGYFAAPTGLRRFTFSELREATSNFREMVGRGGFGSVYKGFLRPENRVVAVKRLEGVCQGEEEFWAEVSMICKVNHMNLVRMLGFCAEGKHRLLVYEYMEKGSLDKYIFSTHNNTNMSNTISTSPSMVNLDWKKRLEIALGAAKGLAYLHEECLEWILHCDVKPQNILLDDKLRAKVSDFGLAKLVDRGNGHNNRDRALSFSRIRGTRGYLAPEWTMNLPITSKADVYSFGILLLELVSGRDAAKFNVSESGLSFVPWVCENMRAGKWMDDVVDARLVDGDGELQSEEVERVLNAALACVKQERNERPSMIEVVEMLTRLGSIVTRETGNGME